MDDALALCRVEMGGYRVSPLTAGDKRRRFRELLEGPNVVFAPSCGDAITARLIESLGIPAVHGSGSSLHRQAGYPDAGILTMTEMLSALSLMANAVDIPVIGDADTGFGGLVNVRRTVQEYERAGLAAMHLEDQLTPKRPPVGGDSFDTITRAEMVAKIRVAVDARVDESFVIIARSEVKGDLDEVIERLGECLDAGADVAWLSAHEPADIAKVRAALHKPLIGVLPPKMTLSEYGSYGANCALLPTWLDSVAAYAKKRLLEEFLSSGTGQGYIETLAGLDDMRRFVSEQGSAEMKGLDERFGS